MKTEDILALSAWQAARLLQSRQLSACDYVRACLERITQREPLVQAFAHLDAAAALESARCLDAGAVTGPLHGLTLGVKDVFDTVDMPTQGGSDAFAGHRSTQDAACVATLRAAGAVLVGKTVTTELATFPPNATRHPAHPMHTPGGSSSGSAAAVADRMVSFATATQTLGSTIRPAGYCGIAGFKPSYNLVPRRGVWPNADSLDTVGLMARDVRDVALLASVAAQHPGLMPTEEPDPSAPVVGLCRSFEWPQADAHMQAAFEACATALSRAGARVVEVSLPPAFSGLLQAHTTVAWYELVRCFADILRRQAERIRPELRERLLAGLQISPEDYHAAQRLGRQCRQMLPQVMDGCDVLFTPAATGEAPRGLASTGDTRMNQVWTFLHGPCVSVTGGLGPQGLPLAMQVVGAQDDDAATLRAARWVEAALRPLGPA